MSEIIENNILIALFMGGKWTKDEYGGGFYNPEEFLNYEWYKNSSDSLIFRNLNNLNYHSSWDWLMPCIDKITDMNEYWKYQETGGQFGRDDLINAKFIERTWENVVEFIKWYNQSKN
jgi:hypothetical protein